METTCNCGAIRVKINDDELWTKRRGHVCHCKNCRKTAGSAYGTNLRIEANKVEITGTENLTLYEDPNSLSGNIVKRYFCKTCGNPIKSETIPASNAGQVILKLGIFEKIPTPEFETFTGDRFEFLEPMNGTIGYKVALGGEKKP